MMSAPLDYALPSTDVDATSEPLSVWMMLLLHAIWCWPFWTSLVSFSIFFPLGYIAHVGWGAISGILVYAILQLRRRHVGRAGSAREIQIAKRRIHIVAIASLALTVAHAFWIPQSIVFAAHLGQFERARQAALFTYPSGGRGSHGRIGLYDITEVVVANKGAVTFFMGNHTLGFAFAWTATPAIAPDPLVYPPNFHRRLLGHWWGFVID